MWWSSTSPNSLALQKNNCRLWSATTMNKSHVLVLVTRPSKLYKFRLLNNLGEKNLKHYLWFETIVYTLGKHIVFHFIHGLKDKGKKTLCFANAHKKNINQIQTQLGEILFCFEKAFIIPYKYVSIVLTLACHKHPKPLHISRCSFVTHI